jgi:predicted dehydrogenase
VAPGNYNNLSLKVYGDKAGIEWNGETPEVLRFTPFGQESRIIVRGGPGNNAEAQRVSRMPAGHPEGYVEGFGNLYHDAAYLIRARRTGTTPDPAIVAAVPSVLDGARGMRFIEASVQSHGTGGNWTPAGL